MKIQKMLSGCWREGGSWWQDQCEEPCLGVLGSRGQHAFLRLSEGEGVESRAARQSWACARPWEGRVKRKWPGRR